MQSASDGVELRDGLLVIGPWREDDAAAVYAACQDPEIQRWVPVIPRPYTLDHAHTYVAGDNGFAIRNRGQVAGAIRLRVVAAETGRIGYWCAAHERRRGVATRALRLVCRYALDELGLVRLELITDLDNVASQGVAQKAGFQREGVLRSHLRHPDGHRRDSVMFSLLPGELR